MNFKQKLLRWWLGANRAGLQAGAVSLKSFFGAAGASQIVPTIPALSVSQGLMIFAVAFAYEFCSYLGENPIPELTFEGRAISPRAPKKEIDASAAAQTFRSPDGAPGEHALPTP